MMMGATTPTSVPLKMVGGSNFGRYPEVSKEETWNMIVSDKTLVPYAGYIIRAIISPNGQGRGIYASNKFNHIIVVVDNGIYITGLDFSPSRIATIDTFEGDVYIAENNGDQLAFCDQKNIYIYNYVTGAFSLAQTNGTPLGFIPCYIAFQRGVFIAAGQGEPTWYLSAFNDGTNFPMTANTVGELQDKPGTCVATVPVPGQGGMLFVFGQTVATMWYFTGQQLFPYQENTFSNSDYGTPSAATIGALENMVVWLAANEKSGPSIMYSNGGVPQKISTDGIDYRLAQVNAPESSYGFLFKQDGHVIYQLTFTDPDDNFSIAYDFNTGLFLNTCDNQMNMHIAKRVIYFDNRYFFVSFVDGNLYELNSNYTTYNGAEIPRIRITPTFRLPNSDQFVVKNVNFQLEQGVTDSIQRVDLTISNDGGYSFGTSDGMQMNSLGNRLSKFYYYNLGWANQFTSQYRFWGRGRFVVLDGEMTYYQ